MKVEDISIAELPDECDWPLHSTRARYFSRISHQGNTLRRVGHARETKGEDRSDETQLTLQYPVWENKQMGQVRNRKKQKVSEAHYLGG